MLWREVRFILWIENQTTALDRLQRQQLMEMISGQSDWEWDEGGERG